MKGRQVTAEQAFGATLRELRTVTGLSQDALAFDAGLDRTYISLLERGLRQPTLKTIIVLAGQLGVSPGSLVDATMKRVRS